MRILAALIAFAQLLVLPVAAQAQEFIGSRTVVVESWVEEWDPVAERWVQVSEVTTTRKTAAQVRSPSYVAQPAYSSPSFAHNAARYAFPVFERSPEMALAQYGPFQVLSENRAAVVGSTTSSSPRFFEAMLRDFPEIEVLELIEAPGTNDDLANLAIGRKIRASGIATHVPDNGSVRSGAVELFLAGTTRTMEDGAEFAVHSWLDNYGREPDDFAPDAPENRLYLDYYEEMGMSEERARAFYAMTNSVPHHSALWLDAADMRPWVAPERVDAIEPQDEPPRFALPVQTVEQLPALAYLDLSRFELARLDSRLAFP